MKKIGYLENSKGEKSHTKLMGFIVSTLIMTGWVLVSWKEGRLVEIDPTLLGLLGICITGNGVNKWIESNDKDQK